LPPRQRSRGRGFTIVELMLVVALVGVLAAVALPSYTAHINRSRSLAAATEITAMSIVIAHYADDNPSYPESLADVHMAGRTDPWGQPYQYYNIDAHGRGGARKDHALNPLNTDLDLYSVGADGKTSKQISQKTSLDDVLRARNGKFAGLASDF
jgi:general secretion pathway protein G